MRIDRENESAMIRALAARYKEGARTVAVNTKPSDLTSYKDREKGLFSHEMLNDEELLRRSLNDSFSLVVVITANSIGFPDEATEKAVKELVTDNGSENADDADDEFAALIQKVKGGSEYSFPDNPRDLLAIALRLLAEEKPVAIIFQRFDVFLPSAEADRLFLEQFGTLMDRAGSSEHLVVFLVSDLEQVHAVVRDRDELVEIPRDGYDQQSYAAFLEDMRLLNFPVIAREDIVPLAQKCSELGVLYKDLYRWISTCVEGGASFTVGVLEQHCGDRSSNSSRKFSPQKKLNVRWTDIKGLHTVKDEILKMFILPMKHQATAKRYRVKPGGGMMLYGPPGTGKTMIAEAMASDIDATFFNIKVSDILNKYVGDSEKNVAELFDGARKSRFAVIFFDEIEALTPKRGGSDSSGVMQRVVNQILTEVDGVGSGGCILFIGATNEPWNVDSAMQRPGRFDKRVYVGLPDAETRQHIFESNLHGVPLADDIECPLFAEKSVGHSGADIAGICRQTREQVFAEAVASGNERRITKADVLRTLALTKPSVTQEQLDMYEAFKNGQPVPRHRNTKSQTQAPPSSRLALRRRRQESGGGQPA